jgi:hypothetical protein
MPVTCLEVEELVLAACHDLQTQEIRISRPQRENMARHRAEYTDDVIALQRVELTLEGLIKY